jgi:hypothetical protein
VPPVAAAFGAAHRKMASGASCTRIFVPSFLGLSASATPLCVSAATPIGALVPSQATTRPAAIFTSVPSLMSVVWAMSYSRAEDSTPPSAFW